MPVRAFAIWTLIAVLETLHGVGRTLLLVPVVGDRPSRPLGVFIGWILILGIAWLFVNWIRATTRPQLLAVGLLWLVLRLAFEVGLGRASGFSWERILSDYNPAQGGLMILGMGVLLLAPLPAGSPSRLRPQWSVFVTLMSATPPKQWNYPTPTSDASGRGS